MDSIYEFINKCESAGISDASKIVKLALAEQHRNTRYGAIQILLNNLPDNTLVHDENMRDIMNLKQKSPYEL